MNIPFRAAGAIGQWRFVKLTASDVATFANAATDTILGITQTAAVAVNDPVDMAGPGEVSFVEAGAAFGAGVRLTCDALGRAVAAAPAAGINNGVGAYSMQSAAAIGDIVRVIVVPHVIQG